ncbi:MAG: Gx transporter family protein [Magnetococcales bacterium]|nr:Gx transporter family protein [Magnetococcales bacterium]
MTTSCGATPDPTGGNGSPASSELRRDLWFGNLAGLAIAAQMLEAFLPGLGPWFKPGLANIFTLVAFSWWGWRAAVAVSLVRVVAASLLLGTFLSPTFLLSLSGACGALLGLGLALVLPWRTGPVGRSLLASMAHMAGQFLMAWLVVVGHPAIFQLLPWFLLGAWITGLVNGILTFLILERLESCHSR